MATFSYAAVGMSSSYANGYGRRYYWLVHPLNNVRLTFLQFKHNLNDIQKVFSVLQVSE